MDYCCHKLFLGTPWTTQALAQDSYHYSICLGPRNYACRPEAFCLCLNFICKYLRADILSRTGESTSGEPSLYRKSAAVGHDGAATAKGAPGAAEGVQEWRRRKRHNVGAY